MLFPLERHEQPSATPCRSWHRHGSVPSDHSKRTENGLGQPHIRGTAHIPSELHRFARLPEVCPFTEGNERLVRFAIETQRRGQCGNIAPHREAGHPRSRTTIKNPPRILHPNRTSIRISYASGCRYFCGLTGLGSRLDPAVFCKICPSAKQNTTPIRQTTLPTNAQIIWTNIGGSKTLIRANPVTATTMVTNPPSFSHIFNPPLR